MRTEKDHVLKFVERIPNLEIRYLSERTCLVEEQFQWHELMKPNLGLSLRKGSPKRGKMGGSRKRNGSDHGDRGIEPDVNRTRNLLIWSQTRYHCATDPVVHFNDNIIFSHLLSLPPVLPAIHGKLETTIEEELKPFVSQTLYSQLNLSIAEISV